MKILDCTLRDGGYYTSWDFDKTLVETYIKSCNELPIDYIEIGYRSIHLDGYFGEYFYLPVDLIERIKFQSTKKLVIILNEKDVRSENLEALLRPCCGLIDMIRLAIDPKHFSRALLLAESVKEMGFEVGFNVMYMSNWKNETEFLELLPNVKGIADYFYMVDSYGGVYPDDVKNIIRLVRRYLPDIPLGFHGHNNMELALINTLTAIEEGCEIVDATVTGMGRGAGNVKTELLLTSLYAQGKFDLDFNPLSKVVDIFIELQKKYEWGTNLPYMVSGAFSLPQKDVMDWIGKRYYSFNTIVRALQSQVKNSDIQVLNWDASLNSESVLVVGGGTTTLAHRHGIVEFIKNHPEIIVIHASSKNAFVFDEVKNSQLFCIIGNEGHRLEDVFKGDIPENAHCILPPAPRKMGTYIPLQLKGRTYQLHTLKNYSKFSESVSALALETARQLGAKRIFLVGYDGYSEGMTQNELELFKENEIIFKESIELNIIALTPTKYSNIQIQSIYSVVW
jgi:4-hydroxy 2-oxovalerate aldolase